MERIILAYAGAESEPAIPWLLERHPGTEIVAVLVDLGRRTDLVEQRERALALGAVRCHVVDSRDEFARDYVLPALQAGAFAGPRAAVTPALARPLVARKVVDLAMMENARTIAHGPGRGYDRAPLDVLLRTLDPGLQLITSPIDADDGSSLIATNVWGRAVAVPPGQEPSDLFLLTNAPGDGPERPARVEIEFVRGVPVRVNGIEMSLLEMIESLEIIGGTHGVGRTDNDVVKPGGGTYREVAEAPAAVVLHAAHAALAASVTPKELAPLVGLAGRAYADAIQSGQWFTPTRATLDAFVHALQSQVSGSVRLELLRGVCRVAATAAAVHPSPPAAAGGPHN